MPTPPTSPVTPTKAPPTSARGPAAAAAAAPSAEAILDTFGGDAPWAGAFHRQLTASGVVDVLRGGDPSALRLAPTSPFAGLDPAAIGRAKDALWNGLAPLPDRQGIWVTLYNAGLVPDAPAQKIRQQRGQAAPSPVGAAQGPAAGTGQAAPTVGADLAGAASSSGPSQTAPSSAVSPPMPALAPTSPQPPPPAAAQTIRAPGATTPGTTAAGATGPGTTIAGAMASGTRAPGTTSSGATSPGATASGTATATTVGTAKAPGTTTTAVDGGGGVSAAFVRDLLARALAPRMGATSGRYLGRAGIIDAWSDQKVAALVRGLGVAARFYPMFSPSVLARLVVAEGAQESTGDTTLNVGGRPGDGQGFMQVTWQSVVQDFLWFGEPLRAADGQVVVDPARPGAIDLGDLAQNVALWAWYTRNTVGSRQSLAERLMWRDPPYNNAPTPMVVDFGNAQLTWLAGPRNDRHTADGAARFADYRARIDDYFTQSGFAEGGKTYLQLLDTPLGEDLIACARRPGQDPTHWPPAA